MDKNNHIQVLISTMNQSSYRTLLKLMHLDVTDVVIINQLTKNLKVIDKNKSFHSYKEQGLSRSRNRAIDASNADICILADDDMFYSPDYKRTVRKAYDKYPDADIIAFYVDSEDAAIYKKPLREGRINLLTSMKLRSVQLTFKRKSIAENDIRFREEFGAGAEYYMGEENIFLADCIRAGMKVYSVPIKVATLKKSDSTWFRGFDKRYFEIKGLVFAYISKNFYPLLITQFALRKLRQYGSDVKFLDALSSMFRGVKKHKPRRDLYLAGDFISNTGPANVNRQYATYLRDKAYICKSNNKIIRIAHFLSSIIFVDKVVVSGLSSFHLDVLRISKVLNKDTFYLMHGYNAVEYKINETANKEKRLNLEKAMLDESGTVICVSEKFADFLKQAEPSLRNKIAFVNNGVDNVVVSRSKKKEKYTILTVGGGVPRKNVLNVCKAIANLNDDRISFIVVGPKDRDGDIIARYPFVTYYERLDHEAVLKLMRGADLYVQNSTFETFGLAVCEALSEGCNLLISRAVGADSVIDGLREDNYINAPNEVDDIAAKIQNIMKVQDGALRFSENSHWRDAASRLVDEIAGK